MPRPPRRPARDLRVSLGALRLRNPVLLASGTFGGIQDLVLDCDRLGGIVLKTVTRRPRKGNPPPRIHETPSGMLNSIGLENKGLEGFLRHEFPRFSEYRTALLVSVSGESVEDFGFLIRRLDRLRRIDGFELNISCPNVSHGMDFGTDPARTEEVVRAARRCTDKPVIAKLTPNVTDIVSIARAALEGGADALSLVNTLRGMAIDWRRRRPVLGGVTGGLSGPAIRPVALRMVWEVCSAFPDVPVLGIGGISTADDVLEFLAAGATAVQVGTANFVEPAVSGQLLDDLPVRLQEAGIRRIRDLIGVCRGRS